MPFLVVAATCLYCNMFIWLCCNLIMWLICESWVIGCKPQLIYHRVVYWARPTLIPVSSNMIVQWPVSIQHRCLHFCSATIMLIWPRCLVGQSAGHAANWCSRPLVPAADRQYSMTWICHKCWCLPHNWTTFSVVYHKVTVSFTAWTCGSEGSVCWFLLQTNVEYIGGPVGK